MRIILTLIIAGTALVGAAGAASSQTTSAPEWAAAHIQQQLHNMLLTQLVQAQQNQDRDTGQSSSVMTKVPSDTCVYNNRLYSVGAVLDNLRCDYWGGSTDTHWVRAQ